MSKTQTKFKEKIRMSNRKNMFRYGSFALALAATVSLAGPSFAAPLTSDNLPIANSINGATLQYTNGAAIPTVYGQAVTTTGGLVTNQAVIQAAANTAQVKTLNVDVGTSAVADIGYNSFNVAQNKVVNFNFDGQDQVALNRVTTVGSQYASKINGLIKQTGTGAGSSSVYLLNPNGILFGAKSSVNLNSFTASTFGLTENNLVGNVSGRQDGTLVLDRKSTSTPAGIYFEGPLTTILTSQSATFAANAIINKDKNIQAGNNLAFLTGDGVTLQQQAGGIVTLAPAGYPPAALDSPFTDQVRATTSAATTVTMPNGIVAQLGEITSQSATAKLTSGGDITVIAKMNKDLMTEFKDIVNINSVLTANNNVFMYANNALDNGGKLNINTKGIGTIAKPSTANVDITADGKINVTSNIVTTGDVNLGAFDLASYFGPSLLQSSNMALDYVLTGLTGDSITTKDITAGNLVAVGKSLDMRNLNIEDEALLVGVENLTAIVNNTENVFGASLAFTGGAVKTRNVDAENVIIIGSTIDTGAVEADESATLLGVLGATLDVAYDLSTIDFKFCGGTINTTHVEAPLVVAVAKEININSVDADTAILAAIDTLELTANLDPTLLGIDFTTFMTGVIVNPAPLPTFPPALGTGFLDGTLGFTNGTINVGTIEVDDDAVLLGADINVENIEAGDNVFALALRDGHFELSAGFTPTPSIDFQGYVNGGNVNINDIQAGGLVLELGDSILNDSVDAGDVIALGVKDGEVKFNAQINTNPPPFISIVADISATGGTVAMNYLAADFAALAGENVYVGPTGQEFGNVGTVVENQNSTFNFHFEN